jgi:tetratricopeptide (TPR) repeat protein
MPAHSANPMFNNSCRRLMQHKPPNGSIDRPLVHQGNPAAAGNHFEEGLAYLQAGEPEAAVNALSRCVGDAPAFPDAHVCLGLAHALTHNIYPALDHLEIAAQLDPDSFAAHFTLAQLNFKLRIPQKGYKAAEHALACVRTIEQRRMLTQLLREERERERNGISRPWFNKPFSAPLVFLAGSGLAAALLTLLVHLH